MGKTRNVCRILTGKLGREETAPKTYSRREDNIKIHFGDPERDGIGWIKVVQSRNQRAVVESIFNVLLNQ